MEKEKNQLKHAERIVFHREDKSLSHGETIVDNLNYNFKPSWIPTKQNRLKIDMYNYHRKMISVCTATKGNAALGSKVCQP